MNDINNIYIMIDPNQSGWVKLGETIDLKSRLVTYNTGSRGKQCTYHDTWDVPASFRDKDLHHLMREISEEQDDEWFKVDADEASAMIDGVIDEVWDRYDPEHLMHTIDEHDVSTFDADEWARVEIDQMTPSACDAVLDRFKQAYC
jgi:hypothetical protein